MNQNELRDAYRLLEELKRELQRINAELKAARQQNNEQRSGT